VEHILLRPCLRPGSVVGKGPWHLQALAANIVVVAHPPCSSRQRHRSAGQRNQPARWGRWATSLPHITWSCAQRHKMHGNAVGLNMVTTGEKLTVLWLQMHRRPQLQQCCPAQVLVDNHSMCCVMKLPCRATTQLITCYSCRHGIGMRSQNTQKGSQLGWCRLSLAAPHHKACGQ